MKILVTGGAGFIGSHITDKLIERGHAVVVIDNLTAGKKEHVHPKAALHVLDIQDPGLPALFHHEKFDIVFHCAAQKDIGFSVKNPEQDALINIIGSLNVFASAKASSVSHIIFSSTGGAMFEDPALLPFSETTPALPASPYGIAKRSIEMYLEFYRIVNGLPSTILRYGNVYGPRQDPYGEAGVIAIFIQRLRDRQPAFINGDGKKTRDFIYVDDVVAVNLLALEKRPIGIYNIGSRVETTIDTVARMIEHSIGAPKGAIRNAQDRPGEILRSCLDFEKAHRELGFSPSTPLKKGIEKTIEWFLGS